jgi:hypothetical protein
MVGCTFVSTSSLTIHAAMPDGSTQDLVYGRTEHLPTFLCFPYTKEGGTLFVIQYEGGKPEQQPGWVEDGFRQLAARSRRAIVQSWEVRLLRVTRADHLGPLEAVYG